jgi:hypothetical protein
MSSQPFLPMTTGLCKDITPSILIVEGKDDCNGIYHIAAKHGLQGAFGLWEGGNDQGALERFGGLLASSKDRPTALGIVLDCDPDENGSGQSPQNRWAQVENRLKDLGYEVPKRPDPAGTVIPGPEGYPTVGVWLMPDNQTEGMFEDFLLRLVPPGAGEFARETALLARHRSFGNFTDVQISKAVVHTYLAWQDAPGKPFGIAIRSNMFNVENPFAAPFVDWLKKLYI